MKKFLYLLLVLASLVAFTGCERHHPVAKHENVKTYRVHRTNGGSDDYLYWYLIYDQNTRNYYHASSTQANASYSSLTWERSSSVPLELTEEIVSSVAELISDVSVSTSDLGNASSDIVADYADVPMDAGNSDTGSSDFGSGGDAPSDAGSSDSGGGDFGGGDSGGGDGGGGGGD